jgi:Zn-dependent protease with chaperone function
MLLVRRIISLPLVILGLPAFGLFTAYVLAGPGFRVRLFGVISLDGHKGGEILAGLSAAAVVLGVSLLCAVYGGAAVCGADRRRLAAVFAPLVRCLSLGVAALALIQMSVAVLAAVLFFVGVLHFLPLGVVIAFVAGAFYTAEELIRAAIGLSEPVAAAVEGTAASADAQPALWQKLRDIAAELGARPPDNLVLGLAPAFFATGSKVHLPDKTVLIGETLYLSVAAMRLLSQQELDAVIAHELSHFAGDDTAFTLRFVPIYQRLHQALGVSLAAQGFGALSALPSRVILREAFLAFTKAERRISRAREIAADRAGAAVAGPHALIGAICRLERCSRHWPALVQ